MHDYLFIVNPAAKHGEAADEIMSIRNYFDQHASYTVVKTEYPGHGRELARDATGYDVVVAFGGDGTIFEIVNGLMEREAQDRPALSVIPAGSGNDYGRTLGIPRDVKTALETLADRPYRMVDLGVCNGRWFCNSFALGIDSRIALETIGLREKTGKAGLSLYVHALWNVLLHDFWPLEAVVTLDEEKPSTERFLLFAVTNGPTYGGGFKITPGARPDDSFFDTCMIEDMPRWKVLPRFPFVILGKHRHFRSVTMGKHRRVRIKTVSGKQIDAVLDGERLEAATFDITLHPSALRVK